MKKTENITQAELPLSRQLAILTKLYYGALMRRLSDFDIDRHFSVLITLDRLAGPVTQQRLGDSLKIDKVSMVRVVDYLVKKGYVSRMTNPADRREHFVELTSKARQAMPYIHEAVHELNASATKDLGTKEVEVFNRCLCRISDNLLHEPADKVKLDFKKVKKTNSKK